MMEIDWEHMQTLGVLTQIMHLSVCHAKRMFGKYDLKPGQAGILFVLNQEGEMSQKKLAKKMHLTPPTITSAIQKMEKMGYIQRKVDAEDQRVQLLRITEKGSACIDQIYMVGKQMDEMVFKGMSLEEKLLLKRMLVQVRDNLLEDMASCDIRPPV